MSVDPKQHAENRGWIEYLLGKIPGFHGYLQKEYRRESDYLLRTHLAERLTHCKKAITDFQRTLIDAGRLEDLTLCERATTKIDTLVNQIRGDVRGYSGFFDFVNVGEDVLDRVYELDQSVLKEIETIAKNIEQLTADNVKTASGELVKQVNAATESFGKRRQILEGLATGK